MQSVQQLAQEIVAREGGYVNDPDDPGGATNHGVTIGTMRRLGIDLNGDGKVTTEDVRRLTRARAIEIFLAHYYEAPGISRLPDALRASTFDMYVNAGSNAVKILQRLLREMGYEVSVDGTIGPQTAAAAEDAARVDATLLRDAYGIARRNYYFRLADQRPPSRKFARTRKGGKGGWILRAETFVSSKYHLSMDAFGARVAKWA